MAADTGIDREHVPVADLGDYDDIETLRQPRPPVRSR
jgi:hypothetical protein